MAADTVHEMDFSGTRSDDLVRRVVSPGEMTEIFEGRADFLHYRHVVFDRHVQSSEPRVNADPENRLLQVKICEQQVKKSHIKYTWMFDILLIIYNSG